MKVRELWEQQPCEDTTSANAGIYEVPLGRRKRKRSGYEFESWDMSGRKEAGNSSPLQAGQRLVLGQWRTVGGRRLFFKDEGGILHRSKASSATAEEHMHMRDVLDALLYEGEQGTASKQFIARVAEEMVATRSVQRRLQRLLGKDADMTGLIAALTPVLVHWLEKQGMKVTGAAQAQRDLRTMAKE